MAPLTNTELLTCYNNALANWRYDGFIVFTELAQEWVRLNLPNFTAREIGRLMQAYVAGGGEIDRQKETRPEWTIHEYHYDLRIPVEGRKVYIETRLFYDAPEDPDDPVIHVVSIHDA